MRRRAKPAIITALFAELSPIFSYHSIGELRDCLRGWRVAEARCAPETTKGTIR
jgi:hypothetical protein